MTVCAAAAFPAATHGAATTVATDASPSLPSVVVVPGSVVYTAVDGVRRAGGSAASGPVIPFTGRLRRIAADPEGGRLVDWSLGASGRWAATMVSGGVDPPNGGMAARLDRGTRVTLPRACGGTVSLVGDRAVYVRCRDREPDGRIVAYDLRRRTTTFITTAPDRGLDPVAAPRWVAYASSTTVGVELAPLREATRRMRFVDGADVYDVQADGKLAFIAGTRACPGNGPVIAELGWAAPRTPATTLAPCVSSVGVAIAADRVLAVDIAQVPDRVTRYGLDGSSEVLATADAGSIRALDDDGTTAALVQRACGQERVVLLTGGTAPADLTSAACPVG